MALADTAKLVAQLELDPKKFVAGTKTALGSLGKLEGGVAKSLGKIGKAAAVGLVGVSAAIGGVLAAGVKGGIESLVDLEDATAQVDGAIKQLGLTGQLTSKQVADWANQIESNVGAAFDDKEITAAAATLIRFGKVTPQNLRPALQVMTDLAAKTGSVDSAATLLAKAMADPVNAAGKLTRVGVVLTESQKAQLASFGQLTKAEQKNFDALKKKNKAQAEAYKAGILAKRQTEAQAFLLDTLAKTTTGAAAATQGPYKRALNILSDTAEDAKRALAEGLLPIITDVAEKLRTKLGDPATIEAIRGIGSKIADATREAIVFAESVPWSKVGDGLKSAWDFAGKLFDVFKNLPPEVQGTILALAGLNKLTGGAVGTIVSELAKGLIKGVLGITAAVVNVTAAKVTGGGPSIPGAPTGGGFDWRTLIPVIGGGVVFDQIGQWLRDNIQSPFLKPGERLGDWIKPTEQNTAAVAQGLQDLGATTDTQLQIIALAQRDSARLLQANLVRPIPAPIVSINNRTYVNLSSRDVADATTRDGLVSTGITYSYNPRTTG